MKRILYWLDPYRQSFFYFGWNFWNTLVVFSICIWMTINWDNSWLSALMRNIFVYLPNYVNHELIGHYLVGTFLWLVLCIVSKSWANHPIGEGLTGFISGNAVETLIPLGLYLKALRLQGGHYFSPILLYWLGTTLYEAGVYISDARACSLPLTSADMVEYAAGERCGDWHYILGPLGLLKYDWIFGVIVLFLGMFCVVMSAWSLYESWFRSEKYAHFNTHSTL